MSTFKTEAEQVDDLKRWLKSYGPSILIGILLALGIVYGKQFWGKYKTKQSQQASALYQKATDAYSSETPDTKTIEQAVADLQTNYSSSAYAQYASLLQAKIAIENPEENSKNEGEPNYSQASDSLNWVIKNTKDKNIKAIATLRLAKIQVANSQSQQALKTLAPLLSENSYQGLANVIAGDALLALRKPQEAKQAYQSALKSIPNALDVMPTLQMRIDNIEA